MAMTSALAVVAIVLGQPVHAKEAEEPGGLDRSIFAPILEDFAQRHHIDATPPEIDEFLEALNSTALLPGRQGSQDQVDVATQREIARSMMWAWKVGRELYREYGGEVIFQQFNPVEPVGAYRKLLEERERDGSLKFLDSQVAEKFWSYYRRTDHPMQNADQDPFATPWWRKAPSPRQ
jgi:hypothetical protein